MEYDPVDHKVHFVSDVGQKYSLEVKEIRNFQEETINFCAVMYYQGDSVEALREVY